MKLRVGIVGLGEHWETRYVGALRALEDRFEVRAISSEVGLRAKQAAQLFNATAMSGMQALIERPDIDAILVLAPQWHGPLPILAACRARKAVYCAATLDIDWDQAHEIHRQVDASGIPFMVEFPRRQAPATLRLKELIATSLGPPRLLFCHHRLPLKKHPAPRAHRQKCAATRSFLELIDWCRYIVGTDPTSVVSVAHQVGEKDDYRMMSLDFSESRTSGTGVMAQISCGRYIPSDWPEAATFRPPTALQVRCEKGIAFIDLPANLVWFDQAGRHLESLDRERPASEQLLQQFHAIVTEQAQKTSSLDDAHQAFTIAQSAEISIQENRRVWLKEK